MRKYLLPKEGSFYKANLHCHSVISDGRKTPSEIKEIYKEMGYSIVAYTDHDIFIPHNDLTDSTFLALNGFEVELKNKKGIASKACHLCYIAMNERIDTQPMWNEEYLFGNAPKYKEQVKYDKDKPPHIRSYNSECINDMIETGKREGFFVTYNHPTWSRESYPEYISYSGMDAMEILNGCITEGYDEYNPRVYDDLLMSGKRLWCIGADDNHNIFPKGSRRWDSGVAYTVIKAERLEYNAVTAAMKQGSFYSSEGPEIYELYIEDGELYIKCSAADRIVCTFDVRKRGVVFDEDGEGVTEAWFALKPEYGYARITVTDKAGKHACTNAYFLD